MTETIILATTNEARLAELRDLLAHSGFSQIELRAIGDPPRAMTTGLTDIERVTHAAHVCARLAGMPALVELSWIEIWLLCACYRCMIALAWPDGQVFTCEGRTYGDILSEPRGSSSCELDRIFYYPPLDKVLAELPPDERRSISPRARAVNALLWHLRQKLPQRTT